MHEVFKVEFGHWGVNLPQPLPLFSMTKTEELKLFRNSDHYRNFCFKWLPVKTMRCLLTSAFFLSTKIVYCFFLDDSNFFLNNILWLQLKYLVDTMLIMFYFCRLITFYIWFCACTQKLFKMYPDFIVFLTDKQRHWEDDLQK